MDDYLQKLELSLVLRERVLKAAIDSLDLPAGSHGLDAGCGAGHLSLWLAESIGLDGHVTGVDVSNEFIAYAKKLAQNSGNAERLTFRHGDIEMLPFDDNSFDWAWSVDCAGYYPMEPVSALKELARVVRPGGTVSIMAWSSQMLLPGYPALEARLNATSPGIAPFKNSSRPDRHFLRAIGWFREVGLERPTGDTFAGGVSAPLNDDIRKALICLIGMRWPDVESELSEDDQAEYKRLTQPNSPDFIIDSPDYHAFFTYTMFRGTVAE